MRDITSEFKAHLAQETTTLCTLWKITRTDGVSIYMTDHPVDIAFEGNTYKANTGMTPFNVESSLDWAVDNSEIEAFFDNDSITEQDLINGIYDDAVVLIRTVNYEDLTMQGMVNKKGNIGQVSGRGPVYNAELRGLAQRGNQTLLNVSSSTCRNTFCDPRCGKPIDGQDTSGYDVTATGNVTVINSENAFTTTAIDFPVDHFARGWVMITNAESRNYGVKRGVKRFSAGRFELEQHFNFPLDVTDTFEARAGCDKTIDMCAGKWDNVARNNSEWGTPGDRMYIKLKSG